LGPVLAGALVAVMAVPDLLFVDAATFVLSALTLTFIKRSFNPPGEQRDRDEHRSVIRSLLYDVGEGVRYVWNVPVLRSISIMMALINFVSATQFAQLVLFANRVLSASDLQIAWL